MGIKLYNRLVSEDLLDFLNAETEDIGVEDKHIVLQLDENSWMMYQYESVDELEYDMEEIMSLRLKLN